MAPEKGRLTRERDEARAENERLREVVEAARNVDVAHAWLCSGSCPADWLAHVLAALDSPASMSCDCHPRAATALGEP